MEGAGGTQPSSRPVHSGASSSNSPTPAAASPVKVPAARTGWLGSASAFPVLLLVLALVSLPIVANVAAALSPNFIAPLIGFKSLTAGGAVTPAVCQPSANAALAKGRGFPGLPTLYFIAGAQGAGHEFFSAMFGLLQEKANLTVGRYDPDLFLTADEDQVMDASKSGLAKWRTCPKLPYARQVYDFGAEITARLAALQTAPGVPFRGIYVRSTDTLPMGRVQTPLARPDLVALGMFHGIMYNLRVIVIVRDPAEIMNARIANKTYASDSGLLFRETEDSLTYLDASVRQLPCGTYATVHLDALVGDDGNGAPGAQSAVAEGLASFLDLEGVAASDLQQILSQARSLTAKPEPSARGRGRQLLDRPTRGRVLLDQKAGAKGAKEGAKDDAKTEAEELPKWIAEMEDKASPRYLLWPLYSALGQAPFFFPTRPSQWPTDATAAAATASASAPVGTTSASSASSGGKDS